LSVPRAAAIGATAPGRKRIEPESVSRVLARKPSANDVADHSEGAIMLDEHRTLVMLGWTLGSIVTGVLVLSAMALP